MGGDGVDRDEHQSSGEADAQQGGKRGEEAAVLGDGTTARTLLLHSTKLLDPLKSCNITWTLKCLWVYGISFLCWEILPDSFIRLLYTSPRNSGATSNPYQSELQKSLLPLSDWLWIKFGKRCADYSPERPGTGRYVMKVTMIHGKLISM